MKLKRLLIQNPIAAWVDGRGMGGRSYFDFKDDVFSGGHDFGDLRREILQDLVREIAEWRLEEYLHRLRHDSSGSRFVCKVSHASGRPIIRLPDRNLVVGIPEGWQKVIADGEEYEANFQKIAVNVVRRPGQVRNELHDLLRRWFGPEAGLPGTHFQIAFEGLGNIYRLTPINKERGTTDSKAP